MKPHVLGSEAKEGKGQEGTTSAVGQDPLEIWGCFLILSFLCWPALAARRGRGSSGQDQGDQEVQIMMISVELPLTGAYDIQTPQGHLWGLPH